MHKLARQVRFSVNPFLSSNEEGYNSYASNPPGEGLSIFFELCVELSGRVEPATGFVVDAAEIENRVRRFAVPIFTEHIRGKFCKAEHSSLFDIAKLMRLVWEQLSDKFGSARLNKLALKMNPFRKISIDVEDCRMIYFGEKFEFAATHKLWNEDFSERRNLEVFGKCANASGHGHNYIVEVTVKMPASCDGFNIRDFERTVSDNFIEVVDHRNLNVDVAEFGKVNPTVENITTFAWDKLIGRFGGAFLHSITVWENDKTYSCYYG